jgi:serine/threonine protein kinase
MAVTDPLIGKKLGDYLIEGLLGTGGMARVYRGYDSNLARYAAIKVIEPQLIASTEESEYRERFLREARAIARLSHRNIVGVYQFNQVSNLYYIAMEYIEGRNLRDVLKDYIRQGTVMPTPEALNVLRDIAEALDYAHKQGIIHRDVKPSNVIVKPDGRTVLTDFGLALNAVEGTVGNTFGSVHYIAPEQAISSAQAVAQSDQYSLGIVAYELMTGRVPFDDASAMSVALKHISDLPPPMSEINPAVSADSEAVVLKALDKDVNNRFKSCTEFVRALESTLALDRSERNVQTIFLPREAHLTGTQSKPALPASAPVSAGARSPLMWIAGVVVAALLVGGGLFFSGVLDTGRAPTQTAVAMAIMQETSNAQSSATALSVQLTQESMTRSAAASETAFALLPTATHTSTDTPQPTATSTSTDTPQPTATDTSTPQPTATDTSTHTPQPTATSTSTHTPQPTATSTSTDTPQPTATDTSTPLPTNTPVPALFITPDKGDPQLLLRYDGRMIVLANRDPLNVLDVSDLIFVLFAPDENGALVESERFDVSSQSFAQDARNMIPERCFQLLDNTQYNSLPDDNPLVVQSCGARPFWLATSSVFWVSEDQKSYFEVRLGPVDVLGVCPANRPLTRSELRCAVDLNNLP